MTHPAARSAREQRGVVVGDVTEVAQHAVAEVQGFAGERTVEVLHHDRDAAERTVGRTGVGLGAGALVAPVDHRVELRVHRIDARERGIDELAAAWLHRRGRARPARWRRDRRGRSCAGR